MNDEHDEADKLGREKFPELIEIMDIRITLMNTMKQNPDYKHEGSGAGQGSADFSFNLKGKTYWVTVSEAQKITQH